MGGYRNEWNIHEKNPGQGIYCLCEIFWNTNILFTHISIKYFMRFKMFPMWNWNFTVHLFVVFYIFFYSVRTIMYLDVTFISNYPPEQWLLILIFNRNSNFAFKPLYISHSAWFPLLFISIRFQTMAGYFFRK